MQNKVMLGGNIFGYFTNFSETERILQEASDHGIRAIDTADVYGDGLSEKHIGRALNKEREQWFIASKVGLHSHGNPRGLARKDNILNKVKHSLSRLKTDYIDLYQLHHYDPLTPLEETVEALSLLKEQGVIKEAGVSNYSPDQLNTLSAHQLFTTHQIPFNLMNPSKSKMLANYSKDLGMSTISYSTLARGLFHEKYLLKEIPEQSRASNSESVRNDLTVGFKQKLRKMSDLCTNKDIRLSAIALHWVLKYESLRYAIVGVRNVDQLRCISSYIKSGINHSILCDVEQIWSEDEQTVVCV